MAFSPNSFTVDLSLAPGAAPLPETKSDTTPICAVWQPSICQTLAAGNLRTAIDQLLRLEARGDGSSEGHARIALLLADSYARLGFTEDATEWLSLAQRRTAKFEGRDVQANFDATQAAVLHWLGDEVNTIRAANAALGKHSRRNADPERRPLLATLSRAYLRLGQIGKAEACVAAMLVPAGSNTDVTTPAALCLLGEIKLWSVLRKHPAFRAQILVCDDLASQSAGGSELIAAALAAYGEAVRATPDQEFWHRTALVGLATARLAGRAQHADWHTLEAHIAWLNTQGLRYERDVMRLNLGVLLLFQQRAVDARRWLMPLADAAMDKQGAPLEHDALYFASVACGASGNDRAALLYLNRYNVRIRDQHLSRVTLPPPNLGAALEACEQRTLQRRRGESDREIVAHVIERLRDAPHVRLDSRQLAQMAGVSRRTLENGFRRITGYAPKEFTTRFRLAEFAKRRAKLEAPGPVELEALARSVGFASCRTLARCAERLKVGSNDEQPEALPQIN